MEYRQILTKLEELQCCRHQVVDEIKHLRKLLSETAWVEYHMNKLRQIDQAEIVLNEKTVQDLIFVASCLPATRRQGHAEIESLPSSETSRVESGVNLIDLR